MNWFGKREIVITKVDLEKMATEREEKATVVAEEHARVVAAERKLADQRERMRKLEQLAGSVQYLNSDHYRDAVRRDQAFRSRPRRMMVWEWLQAIFGPDTVEGEVFQENGQPVKRENSNNLKTNNIKPDFKSKLPKR